MGWTVRQGLTTATGVVVAVLAALLLGLQDPWWSAISAWVVAAPVLPYRYYGPVEGRIVDIDRSFSDAIRLTLDGVALPKLVDTAPPAQVRVALHGDHRQDRLVPGTRVGFRA